MESMKAMSVGVIFGIIFAILVMGMIIVFGSDVITSIFCMGGDAQTQKVIGNLQDFVDELYVLPSGSGDYFTLSLPGDSEMCFVNSSDPRPVVLDPVYRKLISDNGYNIWYQQCSGLSGGKIDHLYVSSDKNFCTGPGTRIYLQNAGRWVTIIED